MNNISCKSAKKGIKMHNNVFMPFYIDKNAKT